MTRRTTLKEPGRRAAPRGARRRKLPDGPAAVLDPKGRVLAFNPALRKLFGLPREAEPGRSAGALFPRRLAAQWRTMLGELARTGLPVTRQADYRERCYESVMLPEVDASGKATRVLLLVSDVTDAKAAESASAVLAREWQQTFDSISDIVALISPDYELMRINRTGCLALGKSEAELIGQKCYHVVHHQDEPIEGCPCREALQAKQDLVGEVTDHGMTYIATASPILDDRGNVVAFTHTVKDITERKKMEEELASHRDRLAELVEERTRELMEAQTAALNESRLAAVGRIAGSLAREMRVPLEAIRRSAERLRGKIPPRPRSAGAPYLTDIEREVGRMEFALNAILEFSKQSASQPVRSPVRRLLDLAVGQAGLPPEVVVQVDLEPGLPNVYADPHRLAVAFANVLAYAAQTMTDGGLVGVLGQKQDDQVVLVFTDTGAGMESEEARRLLGPIAPDSGTVADFGLAVAKTFIESDRGSIEVRTERGRSPSFVVSLRTG